MSAYIAAAHGMNWDLASGHSFPVVEDGGARGLSPLNPPRMMAFLQSHLREADLPAPFTIHSFRVGGSLSEFLAVTAVDEIMNLGGWKTESVAVHRAYYRTEPGKQNGGSWIARIPPRSSYRWRRGLRDSLRLEL